jgi:hypothetical protein
MVIETLIDDAGFNKIIVRGITPEDWAIYDNPPEGFSPEYFVLHYLMEANTDRVLVA